MGNRSRSKFQFSIVICSKYFIFQILLELDSDCQVGSLRRIMSSNPKIILLFCGKRKSGKDFLTDWLQKYTNEKLTDQSVIIRLSGPLKQCYAEDHGLDYTRL